MVWLTPYSVSCFCATYQLQKMKCARVRILGAEMDQPVRFLRQIGQLPVSLEKSACLASQICARGFLRRRPVQTLHLTSFQSHRSISLRLHNRKLTEQKYGWQVWARESGDSGEVKDKSQSLPSSAALENISDICV